jgi:EAL domain-containing protein (putative c-di-GMP-specific phosphodiesterase class I)/DNA-binding NarL/FixJ family response regulator
MAGRPVATFFGGGPESRMDARVFIDKPRLRIMIAEDDPGVCAALAELIETEPSFELVGTAGDATAAIALAADEQPDVALVDVRMPGGGGVTAARGIARRSPDTKLIALSGQAERATVLQMLEAGVVGYLLKGGSVDELLEAIRRAPEGRASLSIEVTGDIIDELSGRLNVQTRRRKKHETFERRIRKALENPSALEMVFQPIVGLRDGETVGVEALARFAGPPLRSPSLWFAEAATVGLREDLELLAVGKAIEALRELPRDLHLTVNVSPVTLARSRFSKLVAGADSSRLIVEVTEHAPINRYSTLAQALTRLRACGIRLAIDDAGAGYSSLRHILELRPDLIKLDISLIRGISSDRSKQALAAGLISFAAKSGSTIIAEGIEQPAEQRTLVELGVTHGQGFLLGRPTALSLLELRPPAGKPLDRKPGSIRL